MRLFWVAERLGEMAEEVGGGLFGKVALRCDWMREFTGFRDGEWWGEEEEDLVEVAVEAVESLTLCDE